MTFKTDGKVFKAIGPDAAYTVEISYEQGSFPYRFVVTTPAGDILKYAGSRSSFARKNGIATGYSLSGFTESKSGAKRKAVRLVKRHKKFGTFAGSQPAVITEGLIE